MFQEQEKLELKLQAYRERVSALALEYEEKVANLRVELTLVSRDRDQLREGLQQQQSELPESDTIEGEVVQEEVSDTDKSD